MRKVLVLVILLSLALASVSAEDKLRVLVVTGGHGFDRKAFAGMLDSFSDVAWREAQHPQANAEFAADKRTAYDVILLYDMNQKITDEEKGWLMDTLKEGKGLVVLHHALANYQRWNDWARAIGGRYFTAPQEFQGKSWPRCTYKHGVKMTVQIADPQHPITKGLQDFDIEDETYKGYWVGPDVRVLLKVSHLECGEVVGWTKEHGQARVACMVLGHGPSAYGNANYRTLVQRAIQWVGKRLD
ncbi:MAG: ThuA domain-containing protein [Planctomycetes bacterium]|nr:ThuA domain-containing protein [Planctomycetota bacterium]